MIFLTFATLKIDEMGNRREFEIPFVGLTPGVHEFEYEIKDKFFTDFKQEEFSNCDATVKLILEKNTSFLMLKFEIGGSVEVNCDRCGNTLPMELWDEFKMVVKLVEHPDQMNAEEEDPDVYYISRTESHLHIAEWIYEFITLSLPMQRMCNEDEIGGPQCNQEILAMLKKMEESNQVNNNPLSKELEKLKKNIN